MKRRINSTGRKTIGRDAISIRLVEADAPGQPRSFSADLSEFGNLGMPTDARIYIEPYVTGSSSLMRFDFGCVGAITTPPDTALTELDQAGRILFRIRIVDESAEVGKILASANALRPLDEKASDDDRRAILPVATDNLGEGVWELEFPSQARPQLVLNNQIPGLLDRLRSDPLLQGAIVPAAIGEILRRVLDPQSGLDDEMDWVSDWQRWASSLLGRDIEEEATDAEEVENLVRDILGLFVGVSRFASRIASGDSDVESAADE